MEQAVRRQGVPRDEEDCRYTRSFSVEEAGSSEAARFFDSFGFIVFRDVVEPALCATARGDMWALLEEQYPGLRREDPATWDLWSSKGFGMPGKLPIFRPPILRLRQHACVARCFAAVLSDEEIVCSHDRWLLYRATVGVGGPGNPSGDRPQWRTRRNLHLDLNPYEFLADDPGVYARLERLRYDTLRDFVAENNDVACGMGRCVQGILNLRDNPDDSVGAGGACAGYGGTLVVPGSHASLDTVAAAAGATPTVGPMQLHVPGNSPLHQRAAFVALREGSLVIWDQRLVHGSTPNVGACCRFGVPIRFFPARLLGGTGAPRAAARAAAVARELRHNGFGPEAEGGGAQGGAEEGGGGLTDVGVAVFGLRAGGALCADLCTAPGPANRLRAAVPRRAVASRAVA